MNLIIRKKKFKQLMNTQCVGAECPSFEKKYENNIEYANLPKINLCRCCWKDVPLNFKRAWKHSGTFSNKLFKDWLNWEKQYRQHCTKAKQEDYNYE